jgi:dephospho-CoA kinase
MPTSERRAPGDDGLVIIGLIGRTGSGKSTVARALAEDGAVVIDADALGHEVTDHDARVRRAMIEEYGGNVYREDGTLDRKRVAARVFEDPAARARLDRLVHPRILERIAERIDELRLGRHRGAVVIDAALMLDWGLERACDAVVAVVADEPDRVRRLAEARGLTADEARARLAVQRTDDELTHAADVTLVNRGTLAELEHDARDAVAGLIRRAHAARLPGRDSC